MFIFIYLNKKKLIIGLYNDFLELISLFLYILRKHATCECNLDFILHHIIYRVIHNDFHEKKN